MKLTFDEKKGCWRLRVDCTVNGVRRRSDELLPFGTTRKQALQLAEQRQQSVRADMCNPGQPFPDVLLPVDAAASDGG